MSLPVHQDPDSLDPTQVLSIVEASGVLIASPGSREVLDMILDVAARVILADAYALWRLQDDRDTWHLIASRGLSENYERVVRQRDSPSGKLPEDPMPIEDVQASPLVSHRAEMYRSEGICAFLSVPLRIRGEFAGTIAFYHRQPHRYTGGELRTGTALANLVSVALGTAELYERQRALRERAEAAERRSSFLAEAGALLSSSLDYEATMSQLVDLSVPAFADMAVVDVIESGSIKRVALKHLDANRSAQLPDADKQYRPGETAAGQIALRTGRSQLTNEITDEFLSSIAESDEQLPALRAMDLKSYIAAPMLSRSGVLGLLTFVTAKSDRRYTHSDLLLAEELARSAASAIENARLYTQVRSDEDRFRSLAEHLSLALDASGMGVWSWDASSDIVTFDSRAYSIFGIEPGAQVTWTELQKLIEPRDAKRARDQVIFAINNRTDYDIEYKLTAKSREGVWVLAKGRAFYDEAGVVLGMRGVVQDVTERKRWEEKLKASKHELASVLRNVPDVIARYGPDLRYQFMSPAIERHLGVPAQSFVGKTHSEAGFPEELCRLFDSSLQSIFSTGEGNTIEFDLPGPEGVRHFVADATPEFDASGRVASVLTSSRDVTQAKRAAEDLRAMNEELRRANEDLNQFAYSASHDLQEPLRMVAIYSQMLARKYAGKLDAEADEYISYTVGGAHRMEMMVRDLLTYTKAVNISDVPDRYVDATGVLRNVLENLRGAIESSSAEVVFGALPSVRIHEVHLVQIFQNLISNGLKYRRAEPPRLIIETRRDGKQWRFSVADNGVGIPAKYTEHVFGLFHRLYTAAEYPGTGIGLALCRKVVERYGGQIWVESEAGAGSTFYFTVPA